MMIAKHDIGNYMSSGNQIQWDQRIFEVQLNTKITKHEIWSAKYLIW